MFIFMNMSVFTKSGFWRDLFLLTRSPAKLNRRSLGTDDAGIARYCLANADNLGYTNWFFSNILKDLSLNHFHLCWRLSTFLLLGLYFWLVPVTTTSSNHSSISEHFIFLGTGSSWTTILSLVSTTMSSGNFGNSGTEEVDGTSGSGSHFTSTYRLPFSSTKASALSKRRRWPASCSGTGRNEILCQD